MKLNLIAGLVLGVLSTLVFYGYHFAGLLRGPAGETGLPLALSLLHGAVLIVALARLRALTAPASIPFTRLLGAGLIISLIGGLVIVGGSWVFIHHVDPGFLDWLVERSKEQLTRVEMEEAQRQDYLRRIEAITPNAFAVQRLGPTLVTGLLLSLVISAFLRLRQLRKDG